MAVLNNNSNVAVTIAVIAITVPSVATHAVTALSQSHLPVFPSDYYCVGLNGNMDQCLITIILSCLICGQNLCWEVSVPILHLKQDEQKLCLAKGKLYTKLLDYIRRHLRTG